jgi:hypothetical protein
MASKGFCMSMGRFGDPSLYTRTEPLALGLLAYSPLPCIMWRVCYTRAVYKVGAYGEVCMRLNDFSVTHRTGPECLVG